MSSGVTRNPGCKSGEGVGRKIEAGEVGGGRSSFRGSPWRVLFKLGSDTICDQICFR